MATMNLKEDQVTRTLTLQPNLRLRLLGALGNLVWVLVIIGFLLLPIFSGRGFNPESLIILVIVLLFSFVPSLGAFLFTTIELEPARRTMTRTTSMVLLPIRSTTTPFSDLANIEVQFYRQSSGRSSHDAYRVNALNKNGIRIPLNWDGKRDEMFAFGQKISAITGAELLDHSEKPASQLAELMEQARELGVPIPQIKSLAPTPPPAVDATETTSTPSTRPDTIAPELPAEPAATVDDSTAAPPTRDLSGMSARELEQMVAADTTDADARYMLARVYHTQGRLDRAIQIYQETLKTDSSNAEAQNDLGVAFQQRGRRADAEAAYRRAIALDPFSFNAHLNLALLLRSLNRAAEASQEFFQARQNARSNEETQVAEQASSGSKVEARLSGG